MSHKSPSTGMRWHRYGVLLPCLLVYSAMTTAGELYLRDGSRLAGEVVGMQDGQYTIETAFAGRLQVPAPEVEGVNLDREIPVTLSSGDRLVGTPVYLPEGGQLLTGTLVGEVSLSDDVRIVAIGEEDAGAGTPTAAVESGPETGSGEPAQGQAEAASEPQPQDTSVDEHWSGNIALGVNGASGNTDRFGMNGRAEARRETNGDRLLLYTEGTLQKENGETTANEVLAGGSLERDFTPRWFVFGSADFEKDEFEDLELRALANVGVGYFLVRRDDFTWKALAGVGYQHESFVNNGVNEEGIVSFGYDLDYHYNEWLEFMHKLTYFPSLTSPAEDYRLVSNLGMQMPIGHTENWKLRLSLRNQYDSTPRPGIEKLDTVYSLNLVYDFE